MILYNIKENMILVQKENSFLQICRELNIPVRKLTAEDSKRRINEIISSPGKGGANAADLPELLIFHGIEDKLLDKFLAAYREKKLAPIALKAVVTPINACWTLEMLVGELVKEHAEFNK